MTPGFGGGLEFGNAPALLMIDFVKAYLEPSSPLYAGVEAVRDRCVELLKAARSAGIPILHTNVSFTPNTADGGVFRKKLPLLQVFDRGSPLAEFGEGLEPLPGESVVTKQYASAFFGTALAANLTAAGIDTLIIGGVTTSGCVRASTVDAMQHGFIPIVVREAVGDRDSKPHNANLYDLQAKYADVVELESVLKYLKRCAQQKRCSN
ncbi:MAG: isochorismatase family protein [Woeseia sp.]